MQIKLNHLFCQQEEEEEEEERGWPGLSAKQCPWY